MMAFVILLFAAVLAAVCSGSETAFSSAGRIRAWAGKREGRRWAGLVMKLLESPERFLTTTLVGTNVGMVLASSMAVSIAGMTGKVWAEWVMVTLTAVFVLVFAEVIPKQLFFLRRDSIVYPLAPVVVVLRFFLFPLIFLAGLFSGLIVGKRKSSRIIESREEIKSFLVSSGNAAGIQASRILDLGSATANMYMVNPNSLPFVRLNADRQRAVSEVLKTDSEFLLVWESDGETLLGFVRCSELVRFRGTWDLQKLTEGLPYFDAATVPGKIVFELRRASAPAGVVLGSDGQPSGIVTIEKVLDGILGFDGPRE